MSKSISLDDYRCDCPLDFSILVDRWVEQQLPANMRKKDARNLIDKEFLKDFMIEIFELGFKAGKLPVNHPRWKQVA